MTLADEIRQIAAGIAVTNNEAAAALFRVANRVERIEPPAPVDGCVVVRFPSRRGLRSVGGGA